MNSDCLQTKSASVLPVIDAPGPTRVSVALDEEVAAIVTPNHRYADFIFFLKQPTDFYFDGATDVEGLSWELLGPQGMLRYGIAFHEFEGDRRDAMVHAQCAGRYLLRVRAAGMQAAAFSFRLHNLSHLPAHPITGRYAVSLTGTCRVRALAFDAESGDCFSYSPEQLMNGDAEIWLAEAGAASEMRRYQANVAMRATLCRSGRHYLFLSAARSDSRPVVLSFACEVARSAEMAVAMEVENRPMFDDANLTGLTLDIAARAGQRNWGSRQPAGTEPLRQRCRMRLDEPVTLVLQRSADNLVKTSLRIVGAGDESAGQLETEVPAYCSGSRTIPRGEYLFVLDATIDDPNFDADALGCKLEVFDIEAAPRIDVGMPISGQLDERQPTAVFRFDAAAGQSFLLQNRQSVIDGAWYMIDPDGIRKFQLSQESACSVPVEITQDGMHVLVLERFGNIDSPQPFSFAILPLEVTLASPVNRLSVLMEAAHARALRLRTDRDSWLLVSAHNAGLQCRFRKAGARGLYDESWMRSLPHRGQMHRFPTGEYFLTVENGSDDTAEFSFTKVATTFASPISSGLSVSGTLGGIDCFEQYSLATEAGRCYRIDVRGSQDIQWHLIDPMGRLMVSAQAGMLSDVMDFAVHGIYLIVLEAAAGRSHLEFSLQVADVLPEPSGISCANAAMGSGPHEPAG
jgi:hypothetical protein